MPQLAQVIASTDPTGLAFLSGAVGWKRRLTPLRFQPDISAEQANKIVDQIEATALTSVASAAISGLLAASR
jgi:hypothetical protein